MTDQKELEQETTNTTEVEETITVDTESTNELVDQVVPEEKTQEPKEVKEDKVEDSNNKEAPKSDERSDRNSNKWKRDNRRGRDGNRPRRRQDWEKKEFEERMLEVRRVTRVTTWWRQLSFRATVLIWNKNGKIWLGVAKWNDVQSAVNKATHDAYKNIVNVTINSNGSVPYPTETKFKSAYIKLIPALPGTWLKAGASVRQVLELAWYTNILSKIVWTNNKLNNAILAIAMLKRFKNFWHRFNLQSKQTEKAVEEVEKSK